MTSIAVGAARELFERELVDAVRARLRRVFERRLLAAGGKRLAGVLGGLLVPEPLVSKLVAIGFGIWTVWVVLEIVYEYFAMAELFEEVLQRMWDAVLLPILTGPNPPDKDQLRRILACMARCWEDAMAEVSLLWVVGLGKSLDDIKTEAAKCMWNCVETA